MARSSTINLLPADILEQLQELLRDPRVTQMDATAEINALFIMTTNGNLLWEPIDPTNPAENWTQIAHSGGTWTVINAGATTNTWTNKVV